MSWAVIQGLRGLLALEKGTVIKDWGGRIPVALAFPNTYHAGMSNLGVQALYGLLAAFPDVVAERVFLPDGPLRTAYAKTGTPLLSLETQRPLSEFEIVAFSLSHEGDYPGVVRMLDLARIPARREDRRETDPLVLAGGITMRTNPLPLSLFLDMVLMGDGESIIEPLLRAWRRERSSPLPKNDRVRRLAQAVPGAYAPGMIESAFGPGGRLDSFPPSRPDPSLRIRPARADVLPQPALHTQVLTPQTEFASARLVEIGRGCGRGCRFCLASFVSRPPRVQPLASILAALGKPDKDGERVGLVSPAVADHPDLETLIRTLLDQGRRVTFSSLRIEALTPGLADALAEGRLKGLAIAPEAGSERLRASINKGLTENRILEGAAMLAQAGIRRLKLYFMLGLPDETEDDVAAMVDLIQKVRAVVARPKGHPELVVTVSHFVPKPHTPFEGRPMASLAVLKGRTQKVQRALGPLKGVRVNTDPPRMAYLQTLFSRGDEQTGRIVEALARGMSEKAAFKAGGFDPDDVVFKEWEPDEAKPWSFIDHGVDPGFLIEESNRAREPRETSSCRPDICRRCGVCGPGEEGTA